MPAGVGYPSLARHGRGGDTMMGRVPMGATVIPKKIAQQIESPLRRVLGERFGEFQVGGSDDKINPVTGLREFFDPDPGGMGGIDNSPDAPGTGADDPGDSGGEDRGITVVPNPKFFRGPDHRVENSINIPDFLEENPLPFYVDKLNEEISQWQAARDAGRGATADDIGGPGFYEQRRNPNMSNRQASIDFFNADDPVGRQDLADRLQGFGQGDEIESVGPFFPKPLTFAPPPPRAREFLDLFNIPQDPANAFPSPDRGIPDLGGSVEQGRRNQRLEVNLGTGRGLGNQETAHLTPGEVVLGPGQANLLGGALGDRQGEFTVGGLDDKINPVTGRREFFDDDFSGTGDPTGQGGLDQVMARGSGVDPGGLNDFSYEGGDESGGNPIMQALQEARARLEPSGTNMGALRAFNSMLGHVAALGADLAKDAARQHNVDNSLTYGMEGFIPVVTGEGAMADAYQAMLGTQRGQDAIDLMSSSLDPADWAAGRLTGSDFARDFPGYEGEDPTPQPFDLSALFNSFSPAAPAPVTPQEPPVDTLTGLQQGFFDEINTAFPGTAFASIDDSIIDSIIGERQGAASGLVANASARGNLNEAGSLAANQALGTQAEGARTRLGEVGEGVLGTNRQAISDIRDRAFTDASNFQLGDDLFDITPFVDERQRVIDERTGTLGTDLTTALGSEPLFDPFEALRTGGSSQGVVSGSPINQPFLDAIAARETQAGRGSDRRGLGSRGSGSF